MAEKSRSVCFGELYNSVSEYYSGKDPTTRFIDYSTEEIQHYTGMYLVCIDWGRGYPMPGVKLGDAKDAPYEYSDMDKNIGLYTEVAFLKLWVEGRIKVYDENNIRLISSAYWNDKL